TTPSPLASRCPPLGNDPQNPKPSNPNSGAGAVRAARPLAKGALPPMTTQPTKTKRKRQNPAPLPRLHLPPGGAIFLGALLDPRLPQLHVRASTGSTKCPECLPKRV